jgi:hypothetical protein
MIDGFYSLGKNETESIHSEKANFVFLNRGKFAGSWVKHIFRIFELCDEAVEVKNTL